MKRFLCCALLLLVLSIAVLTQQSTAPAPWNVTIKPNVVASSDLTVVNHCKQTHQFQIQLQQLPFLQLSSNQVTVKGGRTEVLPVKFDTTNLASGVYQGSVLVLCQTCASEPMCTQDRELLQVTLTVPVEPAAQAVNGSPTPQAQATPANTASGSQIPLFPRVAAFSLAGHTVHVEASPDDSFRGPTRKLWKIKIRTPEGVVADVFIAADHTPDLEFCDYIKVLTTHDSSTLPVVDTWERTERPPDKPVDPARDEKKPASEAPKTAGETTIPPCKEGEIRTVGVKELKVTVLDGKQQTLPQIYSNKDQVANAAKEFSDYLKKIAEKGGKISDDLPDGDGAGGATIEFMLKYLEQGGTIIDEVLKGKLKTAGATEFTATIDIGVRHIVATCSTYEICQSGKWTIKREFTQTETKDRLRYTKVWCMYPDCKAKKIDQKPGDVLESGEWDAIADDSLKLDPEKADKAAKDFFTEVANILKKKYDELKKFKDECK